MHVNIFFDFVRHHLKLADVQVINYKPLNHVK